MLDDHRFAWQRPTVLTLLALSLLGMFPAFTPCAVGQDQAASATAEFPSDLVDWVPRPGNPIFAAGGDGHWDVKIRERGWILREGDGYHLWFTGYDGTREGIKRLGYASSPDGIRWTRSAMNPLSRDHWVEDMMVVKWGDTYYMFAEGSDDNHAVMLTSKDRVEWKWEGPLDVRLADGNRPAKKPCGTPTVWIEDDVWYLFYEHLDLGVWLATSNDVRSRVWTNVRDDPILVPGPAAYDRQLIALDQIVKHKGVYYAFYHASGNGTPRTWNTNVARSTDLIHWQKFPGNPIVEDNRSSGIVVRDGDGFRLYTMHAQVDIFCPRGK
jgi:hypothetical protein